VHQSEISTAGVGFTYSLFPPYMSIKPAYTGNLYCYRTNDVEDLPGPETATFERIYKTIDSKVTEHFYVYEGESERLAVGDYDYIVLCLVVRGEYLTPVIIDLEKGEEYVPEEGPLNKEYDDNSTIKGTGIEFTSTSYANAIRNKVFSFKSKIDGSITMKFGYYTTDNQFLVIPSDTSIKLEAGSPFEIDFSVALANMQKLTARPLTVIFQAQSGDNVYEAVLIQMIED